MCVCSCWTPDRQCRVFCCMFITVQRIGQHSSPHMLEPLDVHKQHKSTWISIQHRAFRVCEYKCARRARLIGPSNYATIETTNTLPTFWYCSTNGSESKKIICIQIFESSTFEFRFYNWASDGTDRSTAETTLVFVILKLEFPGEEY